MIPELGHFALVLALCIAFAQATLPLIGVKRGNDVLMGFARPAAIAQFAFIAIAFGALAYSFAINDFTVAYVAANSNTHLPLIYRLTAVWGAHEGSLLLWVTILGCWTFAVAVFSRRLPQDVRASVLSVMAWVSIGFLLFMLLTSNPFTRQFPAPLQGRDLNPLLQDPGMVSHPPTLYMGYVGFSVAFAFAIAALIGGRLDAAWARWTRPWTTAAWLFLTVGITLGSWWSYRELGWGGWWFWDPVENASFMPWLVGTALIHSLSVTEKRGAFKSWTVLLAICAFSLSLLGTFLVRSGVLVSVHAFSEDPKRGMFILAFLAVVVGAAMLLYAVRAPLLKSDVAEVRWFSREGLLLLNNVLLVVAAGAVLLGTLYPIVLSGFDFGKISVGPPYFNTVFVPLFSPLVVLVGFAMVVRWRHGGKAREVWRRVRVPLGLAVLVGVLLPWWGVGASTLAVTAALIMAMWAIVSALAEPVRRFRHHGAGWSGLARTPRGVWGMTLAHCGLGITIIGITLASAYSIRHDVSLKPGQSAEVHGYTFRLDNTTQARGPNYQANTADITVGRNGHTYTVLHPQKRYYDGQMGNAYTEAGIDWHPTYDLYASLGDRAPDGGWSMRLYYKPFVTWIWYGGLIMGLGGVLAASDRRYRLALRAGARERELAATLDPLLQS